MYTAHRLSLMPNIGLAEASWILLGNFPMYLRTIGMIIWSGLGFLVGLIGFGCLLASEFLTEAVFKDDQYYQSHGWPKFVAFLVAGIAVWFLGRHLSAKGARRLVDPETNEEVIMKNDHSFFFIPMAYWGPIFLVLGAVLLFVKE